MQFRKRIAVFLEEAMEDPRLGTTHISLYVSLLYHLSLQRSSHTLFFRRQQVMKTAKIRSRYTYNKCLLELNSFGYISYSPSYDARRKSVVLFR
jgi:hypothetical protein